ncbi:MAG: flagellar biosynthesis protein FlhF [Lachnospiraceae bacterium]|nr:flagellar biosynthesis protein FlhF [Lachnospiraceae bacterium]
MIIKKFVAKTEKEATEEARRELGQGIVIMNVRPVKQEGFLAFLRPPRVEVTVALEDEPEDVPLSRVPAGNAARERERERRQTEPQNARQVTPQNKPPVVSQTEQLVRATQNGTIPPLRVGMGKNAGTSTAVAGGSAVQGGAPQGGIPARTPASTGMEQVARATQSSRVETLPGGGFSVAVDDPREPARHGADVGVLEEKLDSLHSLLEERIGSSGSKERPSEEKKHEEDRAESDVSGEMLTFVKLLYNTLISNEVDEIYANQLTDEVEKMNKPNLPLEYVLANVYQKMVLKFGKSETITPADNGPKAVFFIGPTGVGKTTTIAKIASDLYVMQHKKVALLTVDTYRIAAAEQLKTYASIMEIPCRVIYSVEEMQKAAQDLRDYDFLLVDTPGHSMHNEEQRESISSFLHALDDMVPSEAFLVLSATTKYRDLIDIADTYTAMVPYRLIFTKMDETGCAGNLYNIKLHTGAPMSYITNGQNVPDDIAVFDAQGIVKGLLGGKNGLTGMNSNRQES